MQALNFLFPWLLLGLFAIPVLWLLLRYNSKHPKKEIFPQFDLLRNLNTQESQPESPSLWRFILRAIILTTLITFCASPFLIKKTTNLSKNTIILLLIDDNWPNAPIWQNIAKQTENLLKNIKSEQREIYLSFSSDMPVKFYKISEKTEVHDLIAKHQLSTFSPQRNQIVEQIEKKFQKKQKALDIIYFTDGIAQDDDPIAFEKFKKININSFSYYKPPEEKIIILKNLSIQNDKMVIEAIRMAREKKQDIQLDVYDKKSLPIITKDVKFLPGEKQKRVEIPLPLEIQNEISFIKIKDLNHAAATYLLGNFYHKKKIALLGKNPDKSTHPLLSPFYYIQKALSEKNSLIFAKDLEILDAINLLLQENPALFILNDPLYLSPEAQGKLLNFVKNGGTLLRFAGPNLLMQKSPDDLLPTALQQNIHINDGFLSKETAPTIVVFAKDSPFKNFSPPHIIVRKQVLPKEATDLFKTNWVTLENGTPLVSEKKFEKGRIIFVHTALNLNWSNLMLSNFFIEMLQKIVDTSNKNASSNPLENDDHSLNIWRILSASGSLMPVPEAQKIYKIKPSPDIKPSREHPAGFYGDEESLFALNLCNHMEDVSAINFPSFLQPKLENYENYARFDLRHLLALCLLISFLMDNLIEMDFYGFSKKIRKIFPSIFCFLPTFIFLYLFIPHPIYAENSNIEEQIIAAAETHLAYVKTGDKETDEKSAAGLESLTNFIKKTTTVPLGTVTALNIEKDPLYFYPLIYWPITNKNLNLDSKISDKINFYMQHGGTIIFDTADALQNIDQSGLSERQKQLQKLLKDLNIPALKPVNQSHVLSYSFYIMPSFPGLYTQSPLWAIAEENNLEEEPLSFDGVSPLLITANDFAGAWAKTQDGQWKYPLVETMKRQRLWSMRAGLNIVIYVLTGNYKKDQLRAYDILSRIAEERR